MRTFRNMAILMTLFAACGDSSTTPVVDAARAADLTTIVDSSVPPDTAIPLDFATPPDIATPPDMTRSVDMVSPPDLATPPDLTVRDLSVPPDATRLPDLTVVDLVAPPDLTTVDLTPPPDLRPPTCNDGLRDGNETDVDCGGGTCPVCGANQGCLVSGDCAPTLVCGTGNKCRAPVSCNELHTAQPAVVSGVYSINPVSAGAPFNVRCDMVNNGGGWTRVVNIVRNSLLHGDTTGAAGDVSVDGQPAKLSDATINALNTTGYWRYFCGTRYSAYVKNVQNTWTSLKANSYDWSTDRTLSGSFTCPANRANYVFSDYNNGAGPCSASGHTDYAASNGAAEGYGCYNAQEGWNLDGSLWAK